MPRSAQGGRSLLLLRLAAPDLLRHPVERGTQGAELAPPAREARPGVVVALAPTGGRRQEPVHGPGQEMPAGEVGQQESQHEPGRDPGEPPSCRPVDRGEASSAERPALT